MLYQKGLALEVQLARRQNMAQATGAHKFAMQQANNHSRMLQFNTGAWTNLIRCIISQQFLIVIYKTRFIPGRIEFHQNYILVCNATGKGVHAQLYYITGSNQGDAQGQQHREEAARHRGREDNTTGSSAGNLSRSTSVHVDKSQYLTNQISPRHHMTKCNLPHLGT